MHLQRQHQFNLDGAYDYWGMARSQRADQLDSWGIRWQMSLFDRDGLVLYPPASLVQNVGVDSSGTHGAGTSALQKPLKSYNCDSWHWPATIAVDQEVFEEVKALLRTQQTSLIHSSFKRLLHNLLPRQARSRLKTILRPWSTPQ